MDSEVRELAAIIIGALIGFLGNIFSSSIFQILNGPEYKSWNSTIFIWSGICFTATIGVAYYLLRIRWRDDDEHNGKASRRVFRLEYDKFIFNAAYVGVALLAVEQIVELEYLWETPLRAYSPVFLVAAGMLFYLIIRRLTSLNM